MTGSGRRRSSKWDLKEKTLPENPRDCARSSKDASLYEDESRDHMSGLEGMREESIPGFQRDGHYETRKSTGFDGGKQQTRTHSSKSGGRSFRSRSRNKSKSRSRSRSPTRNPRRQPSSNDQSSRSGHTAPLCRDFSAGKCIKGYRCNFTHHGSLGRDLDKRVGNDWERDDKAMRSYSNTSSTERKSTNICNDFLKGRCRKDASCKFPHHDLGSDELRKRTVDGCSYEQNEVVYSEKQPKHNLNGMHEASTDICYATKLILADAPGDYIQNFSDFLDGTRTTGMENDVSSYRDLGGIHHQLDKKFGVLPISRATGVQESQPAFCLNPINGGIEMPYHQETFQSPQPVDSQHNDGTLLHNADVLGGQLSQFPDLSTALSDLLENKNELTQLYAVIDGESQISNSLAYVPPVTSPFNQGTTFRLPYDAMCGDELGYQSVDPNHQELVSKEQENEGGTGKETTEAEEHGPREDVTANGDDHNNEKKVKDVKVMRLFKFSLAEFVKELLKPAWKEGKMSKEVYKTIVKKVVDKVADSIQEAHIPGTKEKIDQYLSFSKPKLTKLVQAYLERYKKI